MSEDIPGISQVPGYHNDGPAYYFEEGKCIGIVKHLDWLDLQIRVIYANTLKFWIVSEDLTLLRKLIANQPVLYRNHKRIWTRPSEARHESPILERYGGAVINWWIDYTNAVEIKKRYPNFVLFYCCILIYFIVLFSAHLESPIILCLLQTWSSMDITTLSRGLVGLINMLKCLYFCLLLYTVKGRNAEIPSEFFQKTRSLLRDAREFSIIATIKQERRNSGSIVSMAVDRSR